MSKKNKKSKVTEVTIICNITFEGAATLFSAIGLSMKNLMPFNNIQTQFLQVAIRGIILLLAFSLLSLIVWMLRGKKYENTITFKVGHNEITIKPADTTFSTTVDDVLISKTSLHGEPVKLQFTIFMAR